VLVTSLAERERTRALHGHQRPRVGVRRRPSRERQASAAAPRPWVCPAGGAGGGASARPPAPDEVFQFLEPANVQAFGYGTLAWEWDAGLRRSGPSCSGSGCARLPARRVCCRWTKGSGAHRARSSSAGTCRGRSPTRWRSQSSCARWPHRRWIAWWRTTAELQDAGFTVLETDGAATLLARW